MIKIRKIENTEHKSKRKEDDRKGQEEKTRKIGEKNRRKKEK